MVIMRIKRLLFENVRGWIVFSSSLKKRFVYVFLWLCISGMFVSCYDDDTMSMDASRTALLNEHLEKPETVTNHSALVQQSDGTWKASECVPLVGVGRVVNQISKGTLNLISSTNNVGAVVDKDPTNVYSIAGVVNVDIDDKSVIAVRDIYRVYAKGQKAGFVIVPGESSLLSLETLSGSVISFCLGGEEIKKVTIPKESSSLLELDLLGTSGNGVTEQTLAVEAPCSFDEIRLTFSGPAVNALSESGGIKYAFVGETKDVPAIKGDSGYPCVNTEKKFISHNSWGEPSIKDYNHLTDVTLTNSVELDDGDYITVNWGSNATIPSGYEVGFVYGISKILGINLFDQKSPTLYAYSGNERVQETESDVCLLGIDLLDNADKVKVRLVLKKPANQLMIKVPKGLISGILGGLGDIIGGILGNDSKLNVYYAYTRRPVTLDNSSYFAFPGATIYTSTYNLPVPKEEGEVTYHLIQCPTDAVNAQITDNKQLAGATVDGAYVIQAVYTKDGIGMSHTSTIYKKSYPTMASGCNTYITAGTYGAALSETVEDWGGSLISLFDGLKNAEAVVDDNVDNYATRTGLNVLESRPAYALRTARQINSNHKNVRAGFVVTNVGLLDVNLLKNFEVRLYNGTTRVDNSGTASAGGNSNVLGLDLIGDGGGRLRISVETNQAFDRMELWTSNLANVSLFSSLRIYGAFVEDVTCTASSSQDLCMEVMANSNYGVEIDYSELKNSSVVDLGSDIDGIGYLIDDDLDTGVEIGGLLKLDGVSFGLNFNEMEAGQPIGVVLDGMSGLANVSALSGITVKAYQNKEMVSEKTSFDLLDLDLIHTTGKVYLEMTPDKAYNRLVITLGGLNVSLAGTPRITGIYTRKDSDGDGIPDCVTDSDASGDEGFTFSEGETCYPEDLVLKATGSYQEGQEYLFECTNSQTKEVFQKQVAVNAKKEIVLSGLSAGLYSIAVHSPLTGVIMYNQVAYVYPQLTEWKGLSTDWNDWDNWTDGKPSGCTNVILPKGVPYYPVLTGESACANIHFEEGSYIQHINYLKYELAFVDMLVKGGTYRMITAPLRETYSGDFFVNTGVSWTKENYFKYLDRSNYPEKRVSPIVYQRIWETEKEKVWQILEDGSRQEVAVYEVHGWTEDFNYLNYTHVPGMGFSLKAGEDGESASYRFRFPKSYTEYNYYYSDGTETGRYQAVTRSKDFIGKLVTDLEYKLTVKTSSNVSRNGWAVGNPFMSVLSIEGFFKDNPGVKNITLDDGIIYTSDEISNVPSGRKFLNPAEGFMISTSESSGSGEYQVTFRADHVYPMTAVATRSSRSANNGKHALFLEARGGGSISYAAVWSFSGADNGVNEMEDAVMMTDRKNRRAVEVFTIADNKALAIQCMNNLNRIPVGLMVDGSKDVTLKIQTDDAKWSGWELVDTLTGKRYRLNNGEVKINLGIIKTTLNRLYLQEL